MAAARPIRLVTGFVTVGFWTLMSRVLGFARDILIAAYIGAGPVAEAFLVAFSLPNMFRRFFAEGAFNTAFVPLFSKKLEAGEDAHGFARDAFSGLAAILVVLTVLAIVFMPALVLAMAAGFAGDVRFELAVDFGRIAFAYILFISLAALLSGVLNASGRFAAAAAAPLLLNIVLVIVLVAAERGAFPNVAVDVGPIEGAEGLLVRHGTLLTWGVLVAGVLQMGLVWIAASRAGFRLVPRLPRLTPEMKRLAIIAAPAMLAGGVVQINLLVGAAGRQLLRGRHRLAFLRGPALPASARRRRNRGGVVLLPDLARRLRAGDATGGRDALSRAGEISMALTIPSAVALVVIPLPIVSVLFERGAFGPDDTAATALALAVYGVGLPAFVLQKVLQPLYFAREDTRSPFRFALVAMVVNAVAAIGFAYLLGFIGAAMGTTLAAWTMVWLLLRGRRSMGEEATFDDRFRRRIWRIVLASLLMGAGLWIGVLVWGPLLGLPGWRYVALAILVFGAMLVYGLLGQLLGAFRLGEFRRALKR
jgi:putative peptidoglycan lipid II flippase